MSLKRLPVFGLLAFLIILAPSKVRADTPPSSPEFLISQFHDVLLETMKNAESLGITGRYERLEPVLTETFHMASMIQIASGSFWRKATEKQREELTRAFSRLTIATYAAQFDGYSGQLFETLGTKAGPQNTKLVETVLRDPTGSDVELVYVLRQIKGQWQAIDVLLDTGISELARKRSEYRQTLKNGGVEKLLDVLTEKTQTLLSPSR